MRSVAGASCPSTRALTNWPKPWADIALDVYLANGPRNGARVDSVCKWLLDELAAHVYADDRQVKLLFAQATRPLPARIAPDFHHLGEVALNPSARLHQADFHTALAGVEGKGSESRQPQLYITAQTRANVLADLRAVSGLDDRWEPFDEDLGLPRKDPLEAMFERDELVDYYLAHDPDSARGAQQRKLIGGRIDFHDQIQQQSVVDLIFRSLLTDLPVDRFGLWSHVSPRIAHVPYIVDVGVLPVGTRVVGEASPECCHDTSGSGSRVPRPSALSAGVEPKGTLMPRTSLALRTLLARPRSKNDEGGTEC